MTLKGNERKSQGLSLVCIKQTIHIKMGPQGCMNKTWVRQVTRKQGLFGVRGAVRENLTNQEPTADANSKCTFRTSPSMPGTEPQETGTPDHLKHSFTILRSQHLGGLQSRQQPRTLQESLASHKVTSCLRPENAHDSQMPADTRPRGTVLGWFGPQGWIMSFQICSCLHPPLGACLNWPGNIFNRIAQSTRNSKEPPKWRNAVLKAQTLGNAGRLWVGHLLSCSGPPCCGVRVPA